jgi:hypothetical protein
MSQPLLAVNRNGRRDHTMWMPRSGCYSYLNAAFKPLICARLVGLGLVGRAGRGLGLAGLESGLGGGLGLTG